MNKGLRITQTFTSDSPIVTMPMAGVSNRIPFPCEFVSVNLLHLTVPFAFPGEGKTGFLLVNMEHETPNVLMIGDQRFYYTWCLPIEPAANTGSFSWFTQAAAAGDDKYVLHTRFLQTISIVVQFVPSVGSEPFPPTPDGTSCSLEVKIMPA